MKIFISAGHTPTRPGACDNGFCEYDEAERWQNIICSDLLKLEAEYFRVPTGTITEKANYINSRADRLDVAVEIHFNSFAPQYNYHKKVEGCETLYYPFSERGKRVARILQDAMVAAHKFTDERGIKEGWYRQDKEAGKIIYILRKTICTCIILEPEFIQHKDEIQAMREDVCAALASTLHNLPV